MEDILLSTKRIGKEFNGVWVLNDIDFTLKPGEIHALVGENGAGKSTFIKILSGYYSASTGEVSMEGRPVSFGTVLESEEAGIRTVHQEINLVPHFSVYENIFVGSELYKNVAGVRVMDDKKMRAEAKRVLKLMDIDVNVNTNAAVLNTSNKKIVEICKVLVHDPKVLIFDEPTASLGEEERKRLLDIITGLRDKGLAIIYVSHNLEEIQAIADRVTVFRDGNKIDTLERAQIDIDTIIGMMLGEKVYGEFARSFCCDKSSVRFSMKNVSTTKLHNVSFDVYKGEILGIAGVVGAGKTEIARAVYGLDKIDSGTVEIDGKPYKPSPGKAVEMGIALVPEERQAEGIIPNFAVSKNVTLTYLDKWARYGVLKQKAEVASTNKMIDELSIKTQGAGQLIKFLSGGNQQKVILARWMVGDFLFGMFDDPTKGIDIKAKEDIYELMNGLAQAGKSCLIFSSYLPELVSNCDRVLVMREGGIVAEFTQETPQLEEKILSAMLGGSPNERQ